MEKRLRGPAAERRAHLLPMLRRHGSIEYARERAIDFAEKASDCLQGLPQNEATEMLQLLPEFVVHRVR